MAAGIGNFIDRLQLGTNEEAQIAIGSSAYGICATSASEQNKTVNLPGFVLQNHNGVTVHIRFENNNTANAPKLNINNTGDIPILQYGGTPAGTNDETTGWHAGSVLTLTYDVTLNAWIRDSGYNTNTVYDNLTAVENGTSLSLVTTGDKYIWNNKSNITSLTAGTGLTGGTLTTSGTIGVNLSSTTPLETSAGTGNVYPVVLDLNNYLAVYIPPTSLITTDLIVGFADSTANAANNYNDVYVHLFNNSVLNSSIRLIGSNNLTIISDANGAIYFDAVNTTYDVFTSTIAGLVPAPGQDGSGLRVLREDGTWVAPTTLVSDTKVTQTVTNDNNTYSILFSESLYNVDQTLTETARKSANLIFNPSTGVLQISDGTNYTQLTATGYSGNAANVSGVVSIAHGGTGVTSLIEIKELLNYTAADFGLANAVHFIGIVAANSQYTPSDGNNEVPTISGVTNYTPVAGDIVIDKDNASEYIYTSASRWEILGRDTTIATALNVDAGDLYTPVYFLHGRPAATTVLLQVPFTINSGMKGVALSHSAFTPDSYVTNIVVTSGEAYLNSLISWNSGTEGVINLQCSVATSGVVNGYIQVIRGDSITANATDIT